MGTGSRRRTDHGEYDDKDPTELDEAAHDFDFTKDCDGADVDEDEDDQP